MVDVRTPVELGALAHAARMARGWNQQQAADAAGVSRRFVSLLESGTHANAEVWRVLAVLNALGVEISATLPPTASRSPRSSTPNGAGSTAEPTPAPHLPDGFDLDAHLSSFRAGPAS